MPIDFEPDETQVAVADSVAALCRQHCPESLARADAANFPEDLWAALAEFGLFSLGTPEGFGGALEIAAAGEALGSVGAPGPIASTLFAVQALPEAARGEIVVGQVVAVLAAPPLTPWPERADLFLTIEDDTVWSLEPKGEAQRVETLAGEPWGSADFTRLENLGPAARPGAVHDVFLAAYLAAGARKLVRDASEYVANRRQFGKTLAQFQAVSHPLAECAIRIRAAGILAKVAAHRIDVEAADAQAAAASARISAENAVIQAINVCHQSYGAMGMTSDGPVYYLSRRLRQMANQQIGNAGRLAAIEAEYLHENLPALRVSAR